MPFLWIKNIEISVPSLLGNRTCSVTSPLVSIGSLTRDHSLTAPLLIAVS